MISGHQEFFFLVIWWAGYFFPFFSNKLSITFVLHAIFFFRQALEGNFFSKSPTPPPPSHSRVNWSALSVRDERRLACDRPAVRSVKIIPVVITALNSVQFGKIFLIAWEYCKRLSQQCSETEKLKS